MADLHFKTIGVWKKIKKVYVKDSGIWKPVRKMYVGTSGMWRSTYQNALQMSLTVAANTQNYNIRTVALAAGWDGIMPLDITITVNSGVIVGSSSPNTPALTVPNNFPNGSIVKLNNNGNIVGCGGNGTGGGYTNPGPAGFPGGGAVWVQSPTVIINNGLIGGGGGGGGSGGRSNANGSGGPGGGGAGNNVGGGGYGSVWVDMWNSISFRADSGTLTTGGAGGPGYDQSNGNMGPGATGGRGGNLGAAGNAGSTNSGQSAGSGGAAGYCLNGAEYVTWSVVGTRLGAII